MEAATAPQGFTGKDFRAALGSFATGITVITTAGERHPYGMTANAFSSVSLDPPLVLVCVKSAAEGSEHIRVNRCFAVNILGSDQEPLSRYFSSKDRPRGQDAFGEISHRLGETGSPLLDGVAAYLDCSLHSALTAGDHDIFIGEVRALSIDEEVQPLLFHAGKYALVRDF